MDAVKAWKDPEYRNSLSAAERAELPDNPAGLVSLSHKDLTDVSGAYTTWLCASVAVSAWLCFGTKGYQSIGCC
ncbi:MULTISPECIES: mersacidin/lichenicidin family type 2 lantibiotic [Streptomyces violaceusniger group]|uniref:Mersacidin/lichenicidin family type 2 lantibiotic n=1 Tax=Streptomyces rhizosphaericus TaxID=114699 RepID=A0A6G4AFV3_9ACTN|nr:mersacidin/lichenicidin family type 2 lantibiotic [Streptomyces rhizosphaericus]MBI0378999.1 mersacidin/lichenicidin family type 2 lantibiotic [Streptomyces albiflaviniger]NEW71694.1 mersacidin/lichenicidin family type 2 lantibiotic [Streptomyces rhizosphaericus]